MLIFEIIINDKYKVLVKAHDGLQARNIAKDFYLKNNHFIEKEIKCISSTVAVDLDKVINI